MKHHWINYKTSDFFDELLTGSSNPRIAARALVKYFKSISSEEMEQRASAARLAIRDMGVCFSLTGSDGNTDRPLLHITILEIRNSLVLNKAI